MKLSSDSQIPALIYPKSIEFTEKVTETELSNLANSLSELDYGELTDLCAAMGFFGSELNIIQGMERTDPLRPYMERIDILRQVVTKWQSLSPENTKQRIAEIMLQNGYYVQALQLDAKCMFTLDHERAIMGI